MTFQEALEQLADADRPGIEIMRKQFDPRIAFSALYSPDVWDWLDRVKAGRN